MSKSLAFRILVLCLALGLPALAPAAAHEPPEEAAEPAPAPEELVERSSSRDGRVVIGGETVEYTATVGDVVLGALAGEALGGPPSS